MMMTVQQKFYLDAVRELKCLRTDQLHTLLREKFHEPGRADVNEGHMAAMLRQLRYGNWDIRVDGELVHLAGAEPDPRLLEAIDVMLELSEGSPQDFRRGRSPVLLRFSLGGKKLRLFSVADLTAAASPDTLERQRMERIVWISEGGEPPEGLTLPRRHFFAARRPDGSHRFYGSSEP